MPITAKMFGDRGRKRAEQLGIDPSRLPPGQSPTTKWPVLDLGRKPEVSLQEWRLKLDGVVAEPFSIGYSELLGLEQRHWTDTDIHCVTRWSQFGMTFDGVDVSTLIGLAEPAPEATHLLVHSYDGYTTNLPLADVLERPALIVHTAQGQRLSLEHGGPVRLLVPHLYLWKSAKWIKRLEILDQDRLGFWEENGYHHRGDPWKEERYVDRDYARDVRRREMAASRESDTRGAQTN